MIPLFKPFIGKDELKALEEIFKTGWLGIGPKTKEFEEKFSKFIGTKHAVGVNSCTSALDLALKILNIKNCDVLVPSITFASTALVALYNNCKPIFVDVDKDTLCMNVEDMKNKITSNTKAVIPVHLGGHPCDMDPIMEIAKEKDMVVIEDCANATGTKYKGRSVGNIGDIGCFSFEAKKNMTTGDGGMMTTNNSDIVKKLKRIRWVGMNRETWERLNDKEGKYSWYYEITDLGYKYNMNDIQAAIGLVQLNKFEFMKEKKDLIIKKYNEELSKISQIKCPVVKEWADPSWWLHIIKAERRDDFISHMSKNGITTGVHFMPLYLHPLFKKYKNENPNADEVWKNIVSLPLFVEMTDEQVSTVLSEAKRFFEGSKK